MDLGRRATSMELGWRAAGGERWMWCGDGAVDLELGAMGHKGVGRGAFGIGSRVAAAGGLGLGGFLFFLFFHFLFYFIPHQYQ